MAVYVACQTVGCAERNVPIEVPDQAMPPEGPGISEFQCGTCGKKNLAEVEAPPEPITPPVEGASIIELIEKLDERVSALEEKEASR